MRSLLEKHIRAVRFLALAALTLSPAAAWAVVPVPGTTPTITPVAINVSAGDQTEPHVSGDWAAYSAGAVSNAAIRYYNFTSHVDAAIPAGDSSDDLLSDISGSRIVFSRVAGIRTGIVVFDASTPLVGPIELDMNPNSVRLGSAIGGYTVAYVDVALDPIGNGELVIHNLLTATGNRITFDPSSDVNPSVSPDGTVVVWEKCASSLSNCDIYQAVKSGDTWLVSATAASADPEANPDSNGSVVVYDATRAGNSDIFWRPVGGGAEARLEMPGQQRNPSIAGGFIAFESLAGGSFSTDVFVYDMVHNQLYQITNTPAINEELTDLTLLVDGRLRVVWTSDEEGVAHNVRGATFALPTVAPTPVAQLMDLIALVLSFNLQHGIENSLDAKLQNILDALNAVGNGNTATACNKLDAFINEVQAQSGHHIPADQADQLLAACDQIKVTLGCP